MTEPTTAAFDVHMHLLPLAYVCLSAYLEFAKHNSLAEAYAQATAADYIASGILKREGNALNIVAVMERSAAEQLMLYEDDLRGVFAARAAGNDEVLATDGAIITERGVEIYGGAGKRLRYKKLVVCPQVMDFNLRPPLSLYYSTAPDHDILRQAEDMLRAIDAYHAARPDGALAVLPFIGINPLTYDERYLQRVLETCFPADAGVDGQRLSAASVGNGGATMPSADSTRNGCATAPTTAVARNSGSTHSATPARARFGGVKVYPPMGFDPSPADSASSAKMELLFAFCESRGIPIVTHCDDQGFRMLPLEESFRYTSPERWEPVLARHPQLWLDFAHFGEQYYKGLPVGKLSDLPQKLFAALTKQETSWRERILQLMKRYPHVYADVSFGGAASDNWQRLVELLEAAPAGDRALYESRLLFGTDWPLSLTKTESALAYWRGFAESAIPQPLAEKLLCINPQRFLFH